MAYCIMRVERCKGSTYKLEQENNREPADQENWNMPASDIDWSRTPENVTIEKMSDWDKTIKDRLTNAGIKFRKNSVLLVQQLYTASPDWFEGKSKNDINAYFQRCLDFSNAHYGRVVNAVIHYDERTPHMHVITCPITEDNRLSARELIGNKTKMSRTQDDFYQTVGRSFGLDRGEVRETVNAREHLTVLQYKHKTELDQMRESAALLSKAQKIADNAESQMQGGLLVGSGMIKMPKSTATKLVEIARHSADANTRAIMTGIGLSQARHDAQMDKMLSSNLRSELMQAGKRNDELALYGAAPPQVRERVDNYLNRSVDTYQRYCHDTNRIAAGAYILSSGSSDDRLRAAAAMIQKRMAIVLKATDIPSLGTAVGHVRKCVKATLGQAHGKKPGRAPGGWTAPPPASTDYSQPPERVPEALAARIPIDDTRDDIDHGTPWHLLPWYVQEELAHKQLMASI